MFSNHVLFQSGEIEFAITAFQMSNSGRTIEIQYFATVELDVDTKSKLQSIQQLRTLLKKVQLPNSVTIHRVITTIIVLVSCTGSTFQVLSDRSVGILTELNHGWHTVVSLWSSRLVRGWRYRRGWRSFLWFWTRTSRCGITFKFFASPSSNCCHRSRRWPLFWFCFTIFWT